MIKPQPSLRTKKIITYEEEDQPTLIATKEVIEDPDSVPESITEMSKYFFGNHPNSKGGQIWTQIQMLHKQEIDNIIADTMEGFKENKARLFKQIIQHWDVEQLDFLKHVSLDIDVEISPTSYSPKSTNYRRAT